MKQANLHILYIPDSDRPARPGTGSDKQHPETPPPPFTPQHEQPKQPTK